ncbi:MAG: APC family permease [Candidatus Heimdallarchaeota archaeon]
MPHKRKISLIGIIGISLTTVIGSGIWKDSLVWSNKVGIFSLVTITIGWLLILTAGLSYAECVSMFPKSGGPYSYVGGVFGKKAGSSVGILYLLGYLIGSTILAFLAALFTLSAINTALLNALNLTLLTFAYLLLFVILAALSNPRIFGIISFTWVVIKIVLVVIVSIIALTHWSYSPPGSISFVNYQLAINGGLWSLMGFELVLVFSGDVENVEQKMPKGLLITLPIILVLYLFVTISFAGLISIGEIPVDADIVSLIFLLASKSSIPSWIVFAFAAFSAAGTGYAILTMVLKQVKVLTEDDVLPSIFKKKLAGINVFSSLFILLGTFIVATVMVGTVDVWENSIVSFIAVGLGLILISAMFPAGLIALYLRIKLPALKRPFKTPLAIIIFPLAILLSLYLLVLNFWEIRKLWPGLVILITFLIVIPLLVFLFQKDDTELPTN